MSNWELLIFEACYFFLTLLLACVSIYFFEISTSDSLLLALAVRIADVRTVLYKLEKRLTDKERDD